MLQLDLSTNVLCSSAYSLSRFSELSRWNTWNVLRSDLSGRTHEWIGRRDIARFFETTHPPRTKEEPETMDIVLIVLRIIHFFGGVFWVGASFFNIGFLQPAVRATGADGLKVMQHLTQRTRMTTALYTAATLTVISGLLLYWMISGFRMSFLSGGYGLVLTIGGVAGLIAWFVAIFIIRGILSGMRELGKAIQAQGRPPTPEQGAAMQALSLRLKNLGQIGVIIMSIALLCMSIARYVII